MTEEQIKDFREKFKRIVFLKSEIKTINLRIMAYTQKDKEDSHKNAILRAIEKKKEIRSEFDLLLCGIEYDRWKEFSRILSKTQGNQRAARTEINRNFWNNKIQILKFELYE